jgi:hypothetical protein
LRGHETVERRRPFTRLPCGPNTTTPAKFQWVDAELFRRFVGQ